MRENSSTQVRQDRSELARIAEPFSSIGSAFIQNDLPAALKSAEGIQGNEIQRRTAMVAASAIRIVMAAPSKNTGESRKLYNQAATMAQGIADETRGSSEPVTQVISAKAALAAVFAQIGLAELDAKDGQSQAEPAKALQLAYEAATSLERSLPAAPGLRALVDVAKALNEARVNGDREQGLSLIQGIGARVSDLPIYSQVLSDAVIEIAQGPEYFVSATADVRGARNLAFLQVFMPTSDLYLHDWAAAQPSSRA